MFGACNIRKGMRAVISVYLIGKRYFCWLLLLIMIWDEESLFFGNIL